ncbi:hypothetical protein niasHT_000817 [Heterodera trifolii]|uniref:Uncharacterized protein n=1 Tax=Heterodera trifolii TaxID=157864 RepID=A0ABD2MAN7_9BILA
MPICLVCRLVPLPNFSARRRRLFCAGGEIRSLVYHPPAAYFVPFFVIALACHFTPPPQFQQIAFSSSPLRRLLRSVQLSTAGKVLLLLLFVLLPLLLIIVLLYQLNANSNYFINSICCCPRRRRSGGVSSSPSGGDSRQRAKGFRKANRRFIAATP